MSRWSSGSEGRASPLTDLAPALRVRVQVVTGKQWVLEAVGEIILRGWREAVGPCAAAIESILIQVRWMTRQMTAI